MLSDLIQVVDCLNLDEVAQTISGLSPEAWEPTTVFGMSGCEVIKDIRDSERQCLSDDHPSAIIMHKGMNEALLKYKDQLDMIHSEFNRYPVPGSYRTNCYRESIQVLRYQPGEYYNWHYDEGTDKNENAYHRTISVVLYLQNAEEGGRTQFPHRYYRPKAGQALVFPSNWCFPHQCEKITKGTKIAAVTWYHSYYNYD